MQRQQKTDYDGVNAMIARWIAGGRKDDALRNRIVESLDAWVEFCARKYAMQFGVSFREFKSAAAMGLMKALEKFDPTVGVRITTYSRHLMFGSMMDSVRTSDIITRTVRNCVKWIGKHPDQECLTIENIVAETGYSRPTASAALAFIRGGGHCSIDNDLPLDGTFKLLYSDPACDREAKNREDCETVAHLLKRSGLDERTKMAIRMYYIEGYKMKEIGRSVGISESRISQIVSDGMERLRCVAVRDRREAA